MTKVFISFAIEDKHYRTMLAGQADHDRTPFEFVDMSVWEAWDTEWKAKCLARIKTCNGMIVLISPNTASASGVRYEIQCAKQLNLPLMLMYVDDRRNYTLPPEAVGARINIWSWPNLKSFVGGL